LQVSVAYLILSDIHANLEALEAVLGDAEGLYDSILCLGDLVGYGADPNAVCEWMRTTTATVIRGNHDRAAAGTEDLDLFNFVARFSAVWTRERLDPANLQWLKDLPQGPMEIGATGGRFALVHGSPADEDEYLIESADARMLSGSLQHRATFFGHTHIQGGFLLARGAASRIALQHTLQMEPDYFYLINPGSVGQPRDGDSRAAYALYSVESQTVEYRRVKYDIRGAAHKIREAGLPSFLASRLYEGV
jgi:predicted phosphodiesterase